MVGENMVLAENPQTLNELCWNHLYSNHVFTSTDNVRLELSDLVGALLDALLGVEARVVAPGLEVLFLLLTYV